MNLVYALTEFFKSENVHEIQVIVPQKEDVYVFSLINDKPCLTLKNAHPHQSNFPWEILNLTYENNTWFFTINLFFKGTSIKSENQIWKVKKLFVIKKITPIDFLMQNLGV